MTLLYAFIIIALIALIYLLNRKKQIEFDIAATLSAKGVACHPDGDRHLVELSSLARLWLIHAEEQPAPPAPTVEASPPTETPLAWLNIDAFIAEIVEKINIVAGSRFEAFTFDGIAYIQTNSVWNAVKKLAREAGEEELLTKDDDKEYRRQVLYTVKVMLEERGCVAKDLVKEGYFGGKFLVHICDREKPLDGWFLPLVGFTELEERKSGVLLDIIAVEINKEGKE
jgi:hypothetical protein